MLVYVRPSNEALLRARVPGAQDQRGRPSNPFHHGDSASKKGTWLLPPPLACAAIGLVNLNNPLSLDGFKWSGADSRKDTTPASMTRTRL
jgi:hypothetical protein